MKKLLFISFVAFGCSAIKPHIQHSPVTVVSHDTTKIWILNQGYGPIIYNVWSKGTYGDKTKPYLVDSSTFASLCKKSVPCKCSEFKKSNIVGNVGSTSMNVVKQ
jgi:hypothetical protein